MPAVYATAKPGVRTRIASAAAGRARDRRHRWLLEICERSPGLRVVDIGCGPVGLRQWAPELDITGVDVRPQPRYPGPFVCADATRPLPFADAEFDLAFCNSVVEHVPFARRVLLAAEICRVARGWWVQTPAYGFPVEPHALLPAAHWLPRPLRRLYWQVGVAREWEEIGLLRQADLLGLFGPPVIAERVGPAVKSWIAIRVPRTRRDQVL